MLVHQSLDRQSGGENGHDPIVAAWADIGAEITVVGVAEAAGDGEVERLGTLETRP